MSKCLGQNLHKPAIFDVNTLVQAGIDPKTGLPIKIAGVNAGELKTNIKKNLRILDEQTAVRRYKWYNLPNGLNGELLERILYYRGQGSFFYIKETNEFYFLPYALAGDIDVYGRYKRITPLPFNGKSNLDKDGKEKPWIQGLYRNPKYGIKLDELTEDDINNSCVLLHDYCKQLSQINIARQVLNDPLLDSMAEKIPFMDTCLLNGTGIKGMRVNDPDEKENVKEASKGVKQAALTGNPWVPFVGSFELQELTNGTSVKPEEFMLALQSLDNFRLSLYGLENGGLFEKKAHLLESENAINQANVGLIYQDGLTIRQDFCNIVNSIWGLGIWVEPSEAVLGVDQNMDGAAFDIDESNGGDSDEGGEDNGNNNESI